MTATGTVRLAFLFFISLRLLCSTAVFGQLPPAIQDVPPHFTFDKETAAKLRPQLMAQSIAATGRYTTARLVFDRLVKQVSAQTGERMGWQIRVVEDDRINAYSSPDGSIYVENGLARIADASSGLWAAILSHEIAHVLRRDWARRYLYEKFLESGHGGSMTLGDPSLPGGSWSNSEKTSADLGRFCRQIELEADREGLMMMARAGFHPDFVPALYHLIHAQASRPENTTAYSMHPCWEDRDRDLSHAYVQASIEFARRWPEWYASPGGNPPVIVFAYQPSIKKIGKKQWEILVPMRCENLAGAVEVVLRSEAERREKISLERLPVAAKGESEQRELTGCTSPTATVSFTVADAASNKESQTRWTDVYVIDAWGGILARADLPKFPH